MVCVTGVKLLVMVRVPVNVFWLLIVNVPVWSCDPKNVRLSVSPSGFERVKTVWPAFWVMVCSVKFTLARAEVDPEVSPVVEMLASMNPMTFKGVQAKKKATNVNHAHLESFMRPLYQKGKKMFLFCLFVWGCVFSFPNQYAGVYSPTASFEKKITSPSGRYVYGYSNAPAVLMVLDLWLFDEIETQTVNHAITDVALNATGEKLFVLKGNGMNVDVYDLSNPRDLKYKETLLVQANKNGVALFYTKVDGKEFLICLQDTYQDVSIYNLTDTTEEPSQSLNEKIIRWTIFNDQKNLAALTESGGFESYSLFPFSKVGNTFSLFDGFTDLKELKVYKSDSKHYFSMLRNNQEALLWTVNATFDVQWIDVNPSVVGQDNLTFDETPQEVEFGFEQEMADQPNVLVLWVSFRDSKKIEMYSLKNVSPEPLDSFETTVLPHEGGMSVYPKNDTYLFLRNKNETTYSIYTDAPILTLNQVPKKIEHESEVTFSVTSNVGGTLDVRNITAHPNSFVDATLGERILNKTVSKNQSQSVTFSTKNFIEGHNVFALFVSSGDLLGREGFSILKDTLPAKPEKFKVSFGNQKVFLKWNKNTETDLSHYLIYFGKTPQLEGLPTLNSPVSVLQPEENENLSYTFSSLQNGEPLYVQLAAIDQTGNVSEKTEILQETPEETVGILGLSGERGGCGASGGDWLLMGVVLILFLITKQKSHCLLLVLFFLLPALKAETVWDFKTQWWVPNQNVLRQFLGKGGNENFLLGGGVGFSKFELKLSSGVGIETPHLIGVQTARKSGETSTLWWIPIKPEFFFFPLKQTASWFQPYGSLGSNHLYYSISEPTQKTSGLKHLIVLGFGVKLKFKGDTQDVWDLKSLFVVLGSEFQHSFSSGLDFGGWFHGAGVGVSF